MKFLIPVPKGTRVTFTYDQHIKYAIDHHLAYMPDQPAPNGWYYPATADWGTADKTPIAAAQYGFAARTDKSAIGYGNCIRLQHAEGRMTLYAHLSEFNIEKGQQVKPGDIIALSGYSGNVRPKGKAGAHLHFEVRQNGIPYNAWDDLVMTVAELEGQVPELPPVESPAPPELPPTPAHLKVLAEPHLNIRVLPGIGNQDVGEFFTGDSFTASQFIKMDDGSIWARIDGLYSAVYYNGEWLAEVLK